jgi:uncharacterized protein YndB with AHSA1/START domain
MTADEEWEDITVVRVFDAPRGSVFRAFIDPDLAAQWFGPDGSRVPRETVEIDPRPGGHHRIQLYMAEEPQVRRELDAPYSEVAENEVLAWDESWAGPGYEQGGITKTRFEFAEDGGRTRLELRSGPYPRNMADWARAQWESSFTRLETLLAG